MGRTQHKITSGKFKDRWVHQLSDAELREVARDQDIRWNNQPAWEAAVELLRKHEVRVRFTAEEKKRSGPLEAAMISTVDAVYRNMCRKWHPDKHPKESEAYAKAQAALNDFREQLIAEIKKELDK